MCGLFNANSNGGHWDLFLPLVTSGLCQEVFAVVVIIEGLCFAVYIWPFILGHTVQVTAFASNIIDHVYARRRSLVSLSPRLPFESLCAQQFPGFLKVLIQIKNLLFALLYHTLPKMGDIYYLLSSMVAHSSGLFQLRKPVASPASLWPCGYSDLINHDFKLILMRLGCQTSNKIPTSTIHACKDYCLLAIFLLVLHACLRHWSLVVISYQHKIINLFPRFWSMMIT
jgi:hypothetical protein